MSTPLRQMTTGLEGIEDAILAALREDATIATYARQVASWQGTLEDAVERTAFRDPCILILFAGGPIERRGGHDACILQWQVLVRDRNLRQEASRRQVGVAGEPGTYQMVQDVLRVLAHQDLALDGVEGLRPLGVELLQTGRDPSKHTSAYLVTFECRADLMAVAPAQDLTTIVTELDVPNLDEATGDTTWVSPLTAQSDDLES